MSKLKRSRALRRNLRKQARKGTLSAREQKTLLQQEKRFRKARRPFMKGLGFGAGLGAGALLVPGVGLLIDRLGKDDSEEDPNEDPKDDGRGPDYADPEGMGATRATSGRGGRGEFDEFEDPEGMGATRATGPTDVVVVGEEEEKEEEAPSAEETTEPVMSREEAERQAAQVTAPRVDEFGATVPADMDDEEVLARLGKDRTLYPQVPIPEGSSTGTREYYDNPTAGALERIVALEEAEKASPDYTGGFDFLPADDPMRSLAPILPQQIDRGASEMGGTPKSQARSQVQQAANEAAKLRMEDAAARGQEYNDLLNQVVNNAALVGENPLLGDPGVLRALRGFGRRGGRRSSGFAQGGRVDKSNDLVARIKRKYGLR